MCATQMSMTSRSTLRQPQQSSNLRKSLPASLGTADLDLLEPAPRSYNLLHGILSVLASFVAATSFATCQFGQCARFPHCRVGTVLWDDC